MERHAQKLMLNVPVQKLFYDHINESRFKTRPFVLKGDMEEYTCDAADYCYRCNTEIFGLESRLPAFMGQV